MWRVKTSEITSQEVSNVENLELYERMESVSDEMSFLASIMITYKGKNRKKYIKHGQELLGASVALRGWALSIMEEQNQ
jgi:hypothetical protein